MKTWKHAFKKSTAWTLAVAGVLAVLQPVALLAQDQSDSPVVIGGGGGYGGASGSHGYGSGGYGGGGSVTATAGAGYGSGGIFFKAIEPSDDPVRGAPKEFAWLGVSVEESSEALTSQLGLDTGVGLVVTYVATNSPAAKIFLQKNDVLVEFEGQSLVHPAQLRKLMQARKEGDTVKLVFYRAGKKQTASAMLAKTTIGFGLLGDEHSWNGDLGELQRQLKDLQVGEAFREQMKTLRDSLGKVNIDQRKIEEQLRHSLDQARGTYEQALRQFTNAASRHGASANVWTHINKSGPFLNSNATVTVRSMDRSAKSMVKVDESGTLTLIATPGLHLTAHDKEGNLLFDGEIETPEQRTKVPPEVWKRTEPMIEKMAPKPEAEIEHSAAPPAKTF